MVPVYGEKTTNYKQLWMFTQKSVNCVELLSHD